MARQHALSSSPNMLLRWTLLSVVAVAPADGQYSPAVLAACTARRWLARHAAGVKYIICSRTATVRWTAAACTGLVSCLPALETVVLTLPDTLVSDDLGCLLDALAWCTRLQALHLCVEHPLCEGDQAVQPVTDVRAFEKLRSLGQLRSLTQLALIFGANDPYVLPDVVDALVSLTGLAELGIGIYQPSVVPAALGQLKGLRTLQIWGLRPDAFQAGCFDLPNLTSLHFRRCDVSDAHVLPGISALQSLTSIEFSEGLSPRFFFPQLVQLPRLQRMVFQAGVLGQGGACSRLCKLPADLGSLRVTLLHIDFSGQRLAQFPLAQTQLVALKCLKATRNDFAGLPAGITALSRLTKLKLGRVTPDNDVLQLHDKLALDVHALGDLSGFPALCKVCFDSCEVLMCESVASATWHPSLASLSFNLAHPALECMLAVLQLCQAHKRLRGRNVLSFVDERWFKFPAEKYNVQGLPPCHKFKAASVACGL